MLNLAIAVAFVLLGTLNTIDNHTGIDVPLRLQGLVLAAGLFFGAVWLLFQFMNKRYPREIHDPFYGEEDQRNG